MYHICRPQRTARGPHAVISLLQTQLSGVVVWQQSDHSGLILAAMSTCTDVREVPQEYGLHVNTLTWKHGRLMLREPDMGGVPPLTLGEGERTGKDTLFFLQMLRKTWGPLQTDWSGVFCRPVRPCWNQGEILTKYLTCTLLTQLLGTFCSSPIYFLFDYLMEPKMSPHHRPKQLTHTTNQSKLVQVSNWNTENENIRYEFVRRGFLQQISRYLH